MYVLDLFMSVFFCRVRLVEIRFIRGLMGVRGIGVIYVRGIGGGRIRV